MFQFKQFTIKQELASMKVGTDGVLLGSWADIENASTILDIGTGTGLLAIMCAQRNSNAKITAIEIERNSYIEAIDNIENSPWADRIFGLHTSLQDFNPLSDYPKFDAIICNPPFFTESTKNIEQGKTLARHNDSLPLPTLAEKVNSLLSENGTFSVILPTIEADQLTTLLKEYGLYPQQITNIFPLADKPAKRRLLCFTRKKCNTKQDRLIIEISRHNYTPEYKKLTCDFYL